MAETPRFFRLEIRNAADDDDELILSSFPGDEFHFLVEEPTGDGQSFDPITGAPNSGAYKFVATDPEISPGVRAITSKLADDRARQQLLYRRAYGKISEDGVTWTTLVTGYITAAKLIDAITFYFGVGDSRRREASKELFKNASARFDKVTCVIGGPVRGGFAGILEDHGGWRFEVTQVATDPAYVQIKIVTGFDPRKYDGTFATVSDAIADFTNDWARPYFQPSEAWLLASTAIQGHFPNLRVRLQPVAPAGDPIILVPLSEPEPVTGPWYNPSPLGDNLLRSGESSLWLPVDGTDEDGNPVVFAPSVGDTFDVYVYALPISEDNPLHIYMHPVELWEKAELDAGYVAGVDYDDTVLAALTTAINAWCGGDVRLALRITKSYKLPNLLQSVIYGPFRLSTRITNALLTLFSMRIEGRPAPTDTYTKNDLKSPDGTIFDTEESTAVTAVTLKQQRIRPWTSAERDQPKADALITGPWPVDTIENSADDIPPGAENTVTIGDIPGTIMIDDGVNILPLPFDQFLAKVARELFTIFGRGGIFGDVYFLPNMTQQIGDDINVDMVHRPNAVEGQTPVSQRGGSRRVLIVQRTESADGPAARILDCKIESVDEVGSGGGSEEETDVTAATPPEVLLFGVNSSTVQATWADSYPQFPVQIQFESHPASDTTFSLVYGGDRVIAAGATSELQAGIGTGWTVRARIRYVDSPNWSSWSSWSNEVTTSADAPPDVPTDIPTNLVASSSVTDEAHGEWVNTNVTDQIRINWQASTEVSDPATWLNVAGGNRLLAANTTDDDQPTGAGLWARFRLAYVNGAGVTGPYTEWSEPTAITP